MMGEVSTVRVDVIKEVTKKTAEMVFSNKDIGKETEQKAQAEKIDVTRRMEVGSGENESKQDKIDITKRIVPDSVTEITKYDIKEVAEDYLNYLRKNSTCPETIPEKALDVSKLELQSPEKVAELREEFDDRRIKLRKEWEELNHQEWPKYTEDVTNENEVVIRKAGDCYDAHHVQPLQLGGANEASNLTPLDISKHRDVHTSEGSCTKLVNAVKGVEKYE